MARHDKKLKKGSMLGPYKVIRLIGEGGMGEVYEARDESLNRRVALKVISQKVSGVSDIIKRFMSEGQTLARLNHQNVVLVYALGEENGVHYIVMEYVDGYSLHELVKSKGALGVEEAIHHFKQLLEGVKALHENGIIHRDIKPKNIIIRKDNSVKIVDFGIAKIEGQAEQELTSTGQLVGSIHYTAPEVIDGAPATVQSDIWSLGINLFEMLMGQNPFKADRWSAVVQKITSQELDFHSGNHSKTPEALQKIILKMCEKSPARRYNAVREILRDIQAYKNGDVFPGLRGPDSGSALRSDPNSSLISRNSTFSSGSVIARPKEFPKWPVAIVGLVLALGAGSWLFKGSSLKEGGITVDSSFLADSHSNSGTGIPIPGSPVQGQKIWLLDSEGVRFEWSGSSGDGLSLEVSKDRSFQNLSLEETHPKSPFVTKKLSEEGTYFWRLVQKNGHDSQQIFEPVAFTVVTQGPPQIIYPVSHLVTPETKAIKFYWHEKSGASHYRFQLATDNRFTKIFTDVLLDEPHTAPVVLPAGDYYWRVRAEDNPVSLSLWTESRNLRVQKMLASKSEDKSDDKLSLKSELKTDKSNIGLLQIRVPSSLQNKNILDTKALPAPKVSHKIQKIVLQSGDEKNEGPNLKWDKSSGASAYEVQISKTPDFSQVEWVKTVSNLNAKWDSPQAGKYFWRVRASNGSFSKSPFSSTSSFEIAAPVVAKAPSPKAQVKPSPIKAAEVSVPRIPPSVKEVSAKEKSIEIKSVPPPARKMASIPDQKSLAVPKLKLPPDGVSIVSFGSTPDPISFRWENVNAETYRLEISTSDKFSQVLFSVVTRENQTAINKAMPKGRLFWRIRAEKAGKKSDWSQAFSFEISK